MKQVLTLFLTAIFSIPAHAQTQAPPEPTRADIAYGTHERQVLDFWKADSATPTPVAFFIHGGGWGALDKANVHKLLEVRRLLDAGISVVSTNYRYIHHAHAAGIVPPVKWPLEDAARALQFVRSKATDWNLDKDRIGACGGSAGACSSLWLALHDDMADPQSSDPVARESTRLFCAAVLGAQTTLDPKLVREWMPNASYGGHAFGFRTDGRDKAAEFQRLFDAHERVEPFIQQYSPLAHASADDPPLWLSYSDAVPMKKGDSPKDPTHSVLYGKLLAETLQPLGVEVIVTSKAEPAGDFKNATDYFVRRLTVSSGGATKPEKTRAAIPVNIEKTDSGYRLLRGGEPFFVKGAVYWRHPETAAYPLSTVAAHGGNSIRIGGQHLDTLVAAAERQGLAVTIGIPMKKQREGFDYDDESAVRKQFEEAKAIVKRHKDSPATLIWGVGNELSHGNVADNTFTNLNVWNAVNDIAKMIHELDPHHPAMTVIGTASLRRGDLKGILDRCPDLDLIGINSYRDIAEVPGWLARDGWTKPYLITEWGNDGSWQVKKTAWGSPIEATSSDVADLMMARYRNPILKDTARCLGSYAFFWEQAPWRTPTWYSFYLDSGDRLEAVNTLQHLWTGTWPANRAPRISPMTINGQHSGESVEVSPDSENEAVVTVKDMEGDTLNYSWEIVSDTTKGGDLYAGLVKKTLAAATGATITFKAPAQPGPWRLFVYVRDGQGNVASANFPFLVK